MNDFYSMTVAQLKEQLKERGLPVSGKKAELIARLRKGEKFVSEEKYEVSCSSCADVKLRIPVGYTGGARCPECQTRFEVPLEQDCVEGLEEDGVAGIPSKITNHTISENVKFVQHEGEWVAIEVTPFYWRLFFFGLGISTFWVVPSTMSIESMYYGPMYSELGGIICMLWPLTAVSVTIGGFVAGEKALGTGALVGAVLSPLLWFMGCMTVGP
jgi:hypothetical protein